MIYVIIMITLIIVAFILIFKDWIEGLGEFLLVVAAMQFVLAITIIGASYFNMVNITVYYDNVAAIYGEAIDKYNNSVKDMLAAEGEVDNDVTLTDFSQQGYQETLGEFISDQRYVLVDYNKKLGKKQIYKNNVFWSWLIIMPPERCVPIKLAN